jgi:predicted HTH domain antitoxin
MLPIASAELIKAFLIALVKTWRLCYNQSKGRERGDQMMLKEATVTYPQGVPQLLKMSDAEFAEQLRFLAAVKLYELGRLSSGKAAELAGMTRVEFLGSLERVGVPAINLRDEEVESEIRAARELAT